MLIDGQWQGEWQPIQAVDKKGGFLRQRSSFREQITNEKNAMFPAQQGRYHLYVSMTCPWACRVLMVCAVKSLTDIISISRVAAGFGDQGWFFDKTGEGKDPLFQSQHLHEIYTRADENYTGRATVPILWDKKQQCIVNNESADIIRMFNHCFESIAPPTIDLCPPELEPSIDDFSQQYYTAFNNGVYRAGFAQSQTAYEEAFENVFSSLDTLEKELKGKKYLFGEHFTEADIRIFPTLVRFDAVYYPLFKCNRHLLNAYPNITDYMHRIYALPGIAKTVDIDIIRRGYFSIKKLNPTGIVPLGPQITY